MANDTTNIRYWILDTAAVINALGTQTIVRKLYLVPNAANDIAVIQEYGPTGTLVEAMRIKAKSAVTDPVEIDFGSKGRRLNGFKLSSITSSSTKLHVYLEER